MKYPIFKVHIDKEKALKELEKVFDSGFLNEGETVLRFTKKISKILQTDQLVPVNSCTSAITLALRLSGVNPGDEVITPSQTCIATNTPILEVGAVPIFADINFNTGTIDPSCVEKLITKKTKAVICVAWAGMPPYLKELQKICKSKKISLIQDAAQAFGAEYNSKPICHFSDFTCYSFQAIKHLTTGDGGMLVCKSKKAFKMAQKLKWFGLDREKNKAKEEWEGQRWINDVLVSGYKYNMTNIDAAIGLSQIPHIKNLLKTHIKNAFIYSKLFGSIPEITPLAYPKGSIPSFWTYIVILDKKIDRNSVLKKLNIKGIQAGVMHSPNHYYSCFGKQNNNYDQTNYFYKHQISLPCGWWLNKNDVTEIADILIKEIGV